MKYLKLIFCIYSFSILLCCSGDDDICLNSQRTPRLKLKFKDKDQKLLSMSALLVDVDYGSGMKNVINVKKVDSVLVPLRVDQNPFTEITIRTDANSAGSKIKVNYTAEAIYVSPACGFKKNYKNLSPSLETSNPVTKIELKKTEISDETDTPFYLIF